ncbi:MAG: helix-turn-helix domain-containing protein [Nibricoccus sp.]
MKTTLSNQTGSVANGVPARKFSKAKVVAERLGVCPRTIFRWANDGKIARHKINARVVLFDEAEVLALIEAARIQCS